MKEYSKDEKSLLLYLETCLVDNRGNVTGVRMNDADFVIIKKWKEEGSISFQRVPFHEITTAGVFPQTHTIKFTDEAWKLAHKFRRERAERHTETIGEQLNE